MAAAEWLGTQSAGLERDEAVMRFADVVADRDPQAAALWAATIEDTARKKSALRGVVLEWMRTQPDACAQWCDAQANHLGAPFVRELQQLIAER